ncbi:MAG: tryptophan 2,3-dioxygenase, partial [Acidobacteria bacterium]|nr:tryptophan 2,3-dioxygenase [Acidobacteriota bacterium]
QHDELLFIVIHQVYELWFKQILHELAWLQDGLERNDSCVALATFKRILTILKLLVAQIDVLETMTPVSFLSFRSRIEDASGFQSPQFREVEFLLGYRNEKMLRYHPEGGAARRRLESLLDKPSLWDSFLRFLELNGFSIPQEALGRDRRQPVEENAEVQGILIEIYQGHPLLREICERLVDLDEGLQEWRYRHVKMVERTIGTKRGTGGSAGAAYLKTTLFKALFPDLWAIRVAL